jgi:hypothetical protein
MSTLPPDAPSITALNGSDGSMGGMVLSRTLDRISGLDTDHADNTDFSVCSVKSVSKKDLNFLVEKAMAWGGEP